ncbi:hypothetical protein [Mesorhizobium sp. M8A.F.Ca.ET.142.01.1.1]|uniref:hypothetical protein n=1 Tax=Mesorhizobium sp. M8A.F.Ca.ET.142.01.1.1 TaxID=2563958 RepID=UPI001094092C|nr:hypothetical protein [Mesorhizobium sp. M8A.F.Ca.ET.142.01.1.1]TGT91716.1 hypothetical protein EN804_01180 [Mesorhizobium sp. M8A.F.Ca.ET.161.01.1.1]
MINPGPQLPATVYLPAVAEIDNQTVGEALGGQSRAVLSQWRAKYGLPRPSPRRHGNGNSTFTRTADLAAWLNGRAAVQWI